jgi:hypothetical protein
MLDRIFPKEAGNAGYAGWRLAIWPMAILALMRAVQGANSAADPAMVAIKADGVPLDTYGPDAAGAATALFALLGVYLLLQAVIGAVVLLRYRALLPLTYLMMIGIVLASKSSVALHPIARAGAAKIGAFDIGWLINTTLLALMVVGLVLSLLTRKETP